MSTPRISMVFSCDSTGSGFLAVIFRSLGLLENLFAQHLDSAFNACPGRTPIMCALIGIPANTMSPTILSIQTHKLIVEAQRLFGNDFITLDHDGTVQAAAPILPSLSNLRYPRRSKAGCSNLSHVGLGSISSMRCWVCSHGHPPRCRDRKPSCGSAIMELPPRVTEIGSSSSK